MIYTPTIPGVHTRLWMWPKGLSVSKPFVLENIIPGVFDDFESIDLVNRLPADIRSSLLAIVAGEHPISMCLAYGSSCLPTDIFGSDKIEVLNAVNGVEYNHDSTGVVGEGAIEDVIESALFEVSEYYQWTKPDKEVFTYYSQENDVILDAAIQTKHSGCYDCENVCWVITFVSATTDGIIRFNMTSDMGDTWQSARLGFGNNASISINGDIIFITVPDNDIVYYERVNRLNRNLLSFQYDSMNGNNIKGKGWNDDNRVYFVGTNGYIYSRSITVVKSPFDLEEEFGDGWGFIAHGYAFAPGKILNIETGEVYTNQILTVPISVGSNGDRLLLSYDNTSKCDEINISSMEISGTFDSPGKNLIDLGQIVYADDWYSVMGGKAFRKIQPQSPNENVITIESDYPGDQILVVYPDRIIILNDNGNPDCVEREYYEYVAALIPSMEATIHCDGSGGGLYLRMYSTTDGTQGVAGVGYTYYVTLNSTTTIITGDDESIGIAYINLPAGSDDIYSIVLEISYLDVTWTTDPYFITAPTTIVGCNGECVECGSTHEVLYCED